MTDISDRLPKCTKTPDQKRLLNEALHILAKLGIPMNQTPRRLERMAMVFLACADVTRSAHWDRAKSLDSGHVLTTREFISYINDGFGENISSGSYDDIRRKDLKLPVSAGIIVNSAADPDAARNNPRRGYALAPEYSGIVREYGPDWDAVAAEFMTGRQSLADELAASRAMTMVPVRLPGGQTLELTPGEHNELQKAIVEQFLPRFAPGSELLYLGDASDKFLHLVDDRLNELGVFEISHGELPDVIAYFETKNWLFFIEAVHSTGPMSALRVRELRSQLSDCTAGAVFVSAFENRKAFRAFAEELAWESEVWLADEPDHMIHLNGERFLGPY